MWEVSRGVCDCAASAWGTVQPIVAAIMVTARSDNIFTGACSPKMGTIDIGDPERGDPEDAGSTSRGIRTPSDIRRVADRLPRMTGLRASCKEVPPSYPVHLNRWSSP